MNRVNKIILSLSVLLFLAITGLAEEKKETSALPKEIVDELGLKMVLIPAGEFMMGSEDGEEDEKPEHKVYVDAFYIDCFEVTNLQYEKFAGEERRQQRVKWHTCPDDEHPALVSWEQAIGFCKWRSEKTGHTYRLPTEAEWEKAARGPQRHTYSWGNFWDANKGKVSEGSIVLRGWEATRLAKVGSYQPNEYGLYDMTGNVWEHVLDWYDADYYKKSPRRNPAGPKESPYPEKPVGNLDRGSYKVIRGGSAWDDWFICRAANRRVYGIPTRTGLYLVGFRCVRVVQGTVLVQPE